MFLLSLCVCVLGGFLERCLETPWIRNPILNYLSKITLVWLPRASAAPNLFGFEKSQGKEANAVLSLFTGKMLV